MASIRRSSVFAIVLVAAATAALAQAPARVRGTIAAFDGKALSVTDARGEASQVTVGDKTEIVFAKPIALSDIKPGDFLGVTSVKQGDGKLIAYEVRRFPKPLNPGHRPFDGRDDQTMTNATVGAAVQSTSGRELTMTYEGGAQKIAVPPSATVSDLVSGNPGNLVPGAAVNLTHDANRVALRIQVGPPRH